MAAVTDQNNYQTWIDNKLTPVVPRSVQKSEENPNGLTFEERMEIAKKTFVSVSLSEAQHELLKYLRKAFNQANEDAGGMTEYALLHMDTYYICIDIAVGTLSDMYHICKMLKFEFNSNIVIMAGSVANPNAYQFYADARIDYMRVGVGGGSRCTSSANVSIHYPMATLIDQLNEERKAYAHSHNGFAPTKMIADGGIGWFDDIQKSLALGADAVMCGKIFAECEEACGKKYSKLVDDKLIYFRDYYGMSTKRAQKQTGGNGCKTSEGIDRPVEVKYPVSKWVDNMQSYLRSCMTYTNSRSIQELRENAQVIILGGSGDAAYRK